MIASIILWFGIAGSIHSILCFLLSYAYDKDEKEKSKNLQLRSIIIFGVSLFLMVIYLGILSVQAGYDCADVCDPFVSMFQSDECYCKTITGWEQSEQ